MYEQNGWTQLELLEATRGHLEKVRQAEKEINSVRDEKPDAICPSAITLVEIEQAGCTWNFETGQIEPAPSQAGTVKIPVVGTLSKEGIKVWRSAE